MTQADLELLIENCIVAFRNYSAATAKTHGLLSELILPFTAWQRSEIVDHRVRQSEAQAAYSNAREVMFAALRSENHLQRPRAASPSQQTKQDARNQLVFRRQASDAEFADSLESRPTQRRKILTGDAGPDQEKPSTGIPTETAVHFS